MKISNNRLVLIVLSVSCVGMIGLTTIKNEQLRPIRTAVGYFLLPVQTGVNRVGSAVYSNFKNQEKMRTALADNESLREQVATLTMENTRLQSDSYELSRLRKLYELNQTYGQYRMTGARVIAKDTGNWFHVFRIDKGARDGIKPDMNVVGDGGLIGIVTDVGDNYATVRSIIDDVSRVSAMAIQSNDTCIVSGNLQLYANGKLKISDITDTADIKDGDAIVTSTVSSKFLPGILIGYAGDLKTDPDRLTRSGTLVPVADFETIQEVLVILDLKSEMREDGSFETPRTSLPDPESLTAAETSAAEESSAASETMPGEESGAAAETAASETTSLAVRRRKHNERRDGERPLLPRKEDSKRQREHVPRQRQHSPRRVRRPPNPCRQSKVCRVTLEEARMKRTLLNLLVLVAAFALQSSILPFIPFLSATPNLILIFTFAYAFIYGQRDGMLYGLAAGLLMDLFHSGAFGFFTLFFVWIGFLNGALSKYYYESYITLPLLLCTINEFLYNFYIYVFRFVIRGKFDFPFYFRNIVFPEIIISLLFTLVIYRFFLWYNRKLEFLDQRRATV